MEHLKGMDGWFVNLVAFLGACYFLWSVKGILKGLREDIQKLQETIEKIFNRTDDHETRLSRLEGICKGRRNGEIAGCGD